MKNVIALVLVLSGLTIVPNAHAAGERLLTCAADLAAEVLTNAKAKNIGNTNDVIAGIGAYVRLICVQDRGLANGLDKATVDDRIGQGVILANELVFHGRFNGLPLK